MGWLRVLSEWVGAAGSVIGSDIDDKMLAHASAFVGVESLGNVTLLQDDIFASQIPSNSFDLVHSRFQLAPLDEPMNRWRFTGDSSDPVDGLSSKIPI